MRTRLAAIQQVIESKSLSANDVINADETGINRGLNPTHAYIPDGAERAAAPASDEKARFTSMEAGTAAGNMLPQFEIIECNVVGADLSSVRVINTLHQQPAFSVAEGWELKEWRRTLTLVHKNEEFTEEHVRPYLLQRSTGNVVTAQHKAWMDTPGMVMWVDTVLGPWARQSGRLKLLIMDNVGFHHATAVAAALRKFDVVFEPLPPNMTDLLQPMDLAVNRALKAFIRRMRCRDLYNYFQNFRFMYMAELAKPAGSRRFPEFLPPKPTQADGLRTIFSARKELYDTEDFKRGLTRAFVQAGLWKDARIGAFVKYTGPERTSAPVGRKGQAAPAVENLQLGDLAAEMDLVSRAEAQAGEAAGTADMERPFELGIAVDISNARAGTTLQVAMAAIERTHALAARLEGQRVAEEARKAALEVRRMRAEAPVLPRSLRNSAAYRPPPADHALELIPLGRRAAAAAAAAEVTAPPPPLPAQNAATVIPLAANLPRIVTGPAHLDDVPQQPRAPCEYGEI